MHNSLRIIPIIINWANETACNVVTNATFFLPMGSKLFCGSVTVVDPFCNCNLKPGCVVTTCIICTCLQLKSMSDWPEDVVYQGTHTSAQKTSRLSAASALFSKLGTSIFRSLSFKSCVATLMAGVTKVTVCHT